MGTPHRGPPPFQATASFHHQACLPILPDFPAKPYLLTQASLSGISAGLFLEGSCRRSGLSTFRLHPSEAYGRLRLGEDTPGPEAMLSWGQGLRWE